MRIVLTWNAAWLCLPRLAERQELERDTLYDLLAKHLEDPLSATQREATNRKSIRVLHLYVQIVHQSYPDAIKNEASRSKRDKLLLKSNWMLRRYTIATLRRLMSLTSIELHTLEEVWDEFSAWRDETFGEPLMAETWRAFAHLQGYTRYIY